MVWQRYCKNKLVQFFLTHSVHTWSTYRCVSHCWECIVWQHRCLARLCRRRTRWLYCADDLLAYHAPCAWIHHARTLTGKCRHCARCRPNRNWNGSGRTVVVAGWCWPVVAMLTWCSSWSLYHLRWLWQEQCDRSRRWHWQQWGMWWHHGLASHPDDSVREGSDVDRWLLTAPVPQSQRPRIFLLSTIQRFTVI